MSSRIYEGSELNFRHCTSYTLTQLSTPEHHLPPTSFSFSNRRIELKSSVPTDEATAGIGANFAGNLRRVVLVSQS